MPTMPAVPKWLKAEAPRANPIGVDRKAKAIMGFVMAQEGNFKTPGRGRFDRAALSEIVRLAGQKTRGLRSRFTHGTVSADLLGKSLGRARNARLDKVLVERDGKAVTLAAVRGDLYFDPTAFNTPSGDLATYLMNLAESDPELMSSSLVLEVDEEHQLDQKGRPLEDKEGNPLPPLWHPKRLHAADVVEEGDAVDGLLSAGVDVDRLPDALQRRACEGLDRLFAGQPRGVILARCTAFLQSYLDRRFGPVPAPAPTPRLDAAREKMRALTLGGR